jgi:hypothetical protein
MKRSIPLSLAAVTGLIALGGAAAPAVAGADTLNLSGPSTAAVGQPVLFKLTGTAAPPSDWVSMSWLEVVAIPASAMSSCPPSAQEGSQVAPGVGGAILTIAQRLNKDEAGNFSNQVGATPTAPGVLLICGYTANEVGYTLSRASGRLTIKGGGSSAQGAKPKNLKRPRVKRSGKRLTCGRGKWSNASKYSYRWLVKGKKRASGRSFRVTRKVRGRTVRCSVTASNAAGTTTAVSRALRVSG